MAAMASLVLVALASSEAASAASATRTAGRLLTTTASAPTTLSDTSEFQVTIPSTLHKDGGYPHREAQFGNPSFNQGGIEMAPLVYYASTLCDDSTIDETASYPAGPWQTQVGSPFVLMVDRGDCNFVTKVRAKGERERERERD